ncbi:hypothetical protein V8C86DRAFT_2855117 [Haematococcus lacustris]|nr:hypothetical protein QJQ45_010289 [Haematococcus lacustris]
MPHQALFSQASTGRRLGALCAPVRSARCVSSVTIARSSTHSAADPSSSWPTQWAPKLAAAALSAVLLLSGAPGQAATFTDEKITAAAAEYMELDSKGKFASKDAFKALDEFRLKYNLKRTPDGRLQLRNSKGEWFQCRLDMEVPGTMLLRASNGDVYGLQTDVLSQIDLTDDLVALMVFGTGDWEDQISPIEYEDEQGKVTPLNMEGGEFRQVVGILKTLMEGAEQAQDQAPAS